MIKRYRTLILQISATALEETKILVWHRDKLKLILTMSDPFLKTVLDHVVARDVVRKLTQVTIGFELDEQHLGKSPKSLHLSLNIEIE